MQKRADVLKKLRKAVKVKALHTYSDKNKHTQKVKWFGCKADVDELRFALFAMGCTDVEVFSVEGASWCRGWDIRSVVLKFCNKTYC